MSTNDLEKPQRRPSTTSVHIEQTPTDLPVLSQALSNTSITHHPRPDKSNRDLPSQIPEGHETSSSRSSTTTVVDDHNDDHPPTTYPDGGREAWSVVLGSFLAMVASFGIMNTLGVLQAHLRSNQLSSYSENAIGWIFGLYSFICFFGGIQVGPMFDSYGPRWLLLSGSIMMIGGMIGFAFSSEMYQVILSFSVLTGLGTCLIFTPSIASVGHFFMARRGYATGVATTGGSIGGILFPLILQAMIPPLGFRNSILIVTAICAVFLVFGNLLIKSRPELRTRASAKIDIFAFKDPRFAFTTAGVFLIEWALFVPITYVSSYALGLGLPSAFSYQLLAILNVGSVFGRWLPGLVADRLGRFNTMLLTVAFCFTTILSFWLPTLWYPGSVSQIAAKGLIVTWALLYGFGSGTGISLTPVCVGQICEIRDYGTKFGTLYCVVSFGPLTGVPIAGAILENMGGKWHGLVAFTAASYIGAWLAFAAARGIGGGWRWARW